MAEKTSLLSDNYLLVLATLKRYPGLPTVTSSSVSFFFLQFDVALSDASGRPPKTYKVQLTKVAEINPEYALIINAFYSVNF